MSSIGKHYLPDIAALSLVAAFVFPQILVAVAKRPVAEEGPHQFSGRVHVDSVPLAGAEVELFRRDGARWQSSARAVADAEGRFQLTRVPAGTHIATVAWRPRVVDGELYHVGPNVLDGRFQTPDRSPLWVEITESSSQSRDWRLSLCACEHCRSQTLSSVSGVVP